MSDDLAFRIQLGIILPKLKEKLESNVKEIVEELVTILQAGAREGDELTIEPIKQIFMKDFEILLDDAILPDIEKQISPPVPAEPPADVEGVTDEAEEEAG